MSDTEKFAGEAGKLWNAGNDALDAGIRSQLNQRRQAALDTLERPTRRFGYWVPAAGIAAAVAVTWVWLGTTDMTGSAAPIAAVSEEPDDIEIILADTGLDVLEDLEFYAWLDGEDADAT